LKKSISHQPWLRFGFQQTIREAKMNEMCAAARALAIILSIASAFISVPLTAPLLLFFGGIAAIKNDSEKNSRNYLITIVLLLGAGTLEVAPVIGSYLATIFTSLGIAFVGASIVAVVITLAYRIKRDWVK
jgi:hypothetical protein